MFRRLFAALGYEKKRAREPESVQHLKRYAEQLNEKATRFRSVAARAVMLEERLEILDTDLAAWERRAEIVRRERAELLPDAERICGRLEGQIQEARAELALLHADEAHLRTLLTDERRRFAEQLELARELGHDVSGCLLYVDLTRPARVADTTLGSDDDREFIARVIDSARVH